MEKRPGPVPWSATIAVGASAALLFALEPFVGKVLLPRLGGTPSVWNTCVVVFQALLLAGYWYSNALLRLTDARRAARLHTALILASMALMPLTLRSLWWTPPATWSPVLWIALVTTAAIGLPFILMSATSPLVQVWLSRSPDPPRSVHRLYAASNVASVGGLALYVAVLEPLIGLSTQAHVFWILYSLTMAVALLLTWRLSRAAGIAISTVADQAPSHRVTRSQAVRWLTLSFGASLALYAVNTYITTDIASFPLLWSVPLATFLLAFAAGFSRVAERYAWIVREVSQLVIVAALAYAMWWVGDVAPWLDLLVPVIALGALVLALATALADARPSEARLALYYSIVGLGGVLAGILSVLVLPWAWSTLWPSTVPGLAAFANVLKTLSSILLTTTAPEYPAALVLGLWLAGRTGAAGRWRFALAGALALLVGVAGLRFLTDRGLSELERRIMVGVAVAVAAAVASGPRRLAASGLALLLVGGTVKPELEENLFEARNFFGTLRVQYDASAETHRLKHGTTLHGVQPVGRAASIATTYYSEGSPIGRVIRRLRPKRVLVLGLGTGTLAAYAGPGDRFTFLEIDPLVAQLAADERWFTYLKVGRQRGATIDVQLGDGRLLAERFPNGHFDLVVMDAFASDSVPVHLMTTEALDVFQRKVNDRGVVAVHISNRYFEFRPPLVAAAERLGLAWAVGEHSAVDQFQNSSTWFMLARSEPAAAAAGLRDDGWQSTGVRHVAPWTDDHANVLSALRWWKR